MGCEIIYLLNLHEPSFAGFALVNDSLTTNFEAADHFWVNLVLLQKGTDDCQATIHTNEACKRSSINIKGVALRITTAPYIYLI
jgi:hypothetical protein